jgi:hypothetical protein
MERSALRARAEPDFDAGRAERPARHLSHRGLMNKVAAAL